MRSYRRTFFSLRVLSFLLFLATGGITETFAQCPTINVPNLICAGDNCGAGTPFSVSGNTAGITKYFWDFGDPNTTADTSSLASPSYRYQQPNPNGYTVTLTITRNGVEETCTSTANVRQGVPQFTLSPDNNLGPREEEICKGSTITLQPEFGQGGSLPQGATYLWSTGATTPTITVGDSVKCYSLTITDSQGCSSSARVNVSSYKPDPNPNPPPPPKEESRWYFGDKGGILFEGGQPKPDNRGQINGITEGTSVVSGSDGKLLFYTDGKNVFDKNGTPMKDRNGVDVTIAANNALNGDEQATQGVMIVAQPGCNTCDPVYYVFTTNSLDDNPGGTLLSYSIVDMRLNNGLGQVTLKNQPLFQTSTERITAVQGQPDQNDPNAQQTTWIVTHDYNSNTFRVYPLTPQGIGQPVMSMVGSTHGPAKEQGEGYMKVYEDKLVVVIPGSGATPNKVEIFDFDSATGAISNPITLDFGEPPLNLKTVPPVAYGVELVDDQLFVSLNGGGTAPSRLVQFNVSDSITADSIKKTGRVIATSPTERFGALQIDPYGRTLYLALQGQNRLGVITPGDSSQVDITRGLDLGTGRSQLGLPNSQPPNNRGYGQSFSYEEPPCTPAGQQVALTFQAQPDRAGGDPTKSAYDWKFYNTDGSLLIAYPDAGFGVNDSVRVVFPGPGTYRAELIIRNDCKTEGPREVPALAQTIVIPLSPPKPTLNDASACSGPGATVVLDAYPNATGPAGVVYVWVTPDGRQTIGTETFNATQQGTYRVFVASPDGECFQTDDAQVTFKTLQVNLTPQNSNCNGGPVTLDAGNPGSTYVWQKNGAALPNTSQVLVIRPEDGSGAYSVTVTDPVTGCSASGQTTVTFGAKPRISTPTVQNASACGAEDGKIQLSPTDPNDPNFSQYRYRWLRDGAPMQLVPNTSAGLDGVAPATYTVTVSFNGCDTTLTIAVGTTNSGIAYTKPADVQLTCTQTTGTIDAAPRPAGVTSFWKRGNGETFSIAEDLVNQPPGVYTLTLQQGTCTDVYSVEIKTAPNKPAKPNLTATLTGCGTAFLSASYPGDTTKVTFTWSGTGVVNNGRTTTTATGSSGTTYTLRVASIAEPACFEEVSVLVPFIPTPPKYEYGADPAAACAGGEVLLNAPGGNGWNEFVWTLPNNGGKFFGPQYRATVGGTYTITVRDLQSGCTDTDQVTVTIDAPVPAPTVAEPRKSVCIGLGIPTFDVTNGQGVRWYSNPSLDPATQVSEGPNTPSYLPGNARDRINTSVPGTYFLYVTQTINGCQGPATQVRLDVTQSPTVNLGNDRNACQGQPVKLSATSRLPGAQYRWSNGATDSTITVNRTGTYSVQVTVGGCSARDEVTLTFVAGPRPAIPRREVPLCRELNPPTATLDAGPGANFNYEWRLIGSGPTVLGRERTLNVSALGNYTVTITNAAGGTCAVVDTIRVVDKCEPRVFVPDAFAPGSNRTENKVLTVFGDHVGQIQMKIYNRWGELIYAEKAESIEALSSRAWDGTYLGKPVPTGTYVWQIDYEARDYPDREARTLRGGVLVIR